MISGKKSGLWSYWTHQINNDTISSPALYKKRDTWQRRAVTHSSNHLVETWGGWQAMNSGSLSFSLTLLTMPAIRRKVSKNCALDNLASPQRSSTWPVVLSRHLRWPHTICRLYALNFSSSSYNPAAIVKPFLDLNVWFECYRY